jgi:hypothetical protein
MHDFPGPFVIDFCFMGIFMHWRSKLVLHHIAVEILDATTIVTFIEDAKGLGISARLLSVFLLFVFI